MIAGIGIDIIEIARIGELAREQGDRFLRKIFTEAEISYCRGKHRSDQHFAARFAAKEAVSKALATGWTGDFTWRDVEVSNDVAGRPFVTLHGKLAERLSDTEVHVSLSHSETHVVAMAVLERADRA